MLSNANCLLLAVLSFVLTFDGCAGVRLGQFRAFSAAGVAYVKASEAFLDEAGSAAISADSSLLLRNRTTLSTEQERREHILSRNDVMRQRLAVLHQIRNHARLLRDYFEVIGAMADSKGSESLASAAKGTYDALAEFSPALKNAEIGKQKVSGKVSPVVRMVVAGSKVRALDRELRERSSLIEQEIALQEAALELLAVELTTDLKLVLNTTETNLVNDPYASDNPIPTSWAAKRHELLTAIALTDRAGAAAKAAKKLREGFRKLVANELSASGIAAIFEDINSVVDLTAKIKPVPAT